MFRINTKSLLALVILVVKTECYPDGVNVGSACSSMTPDHGYPPQSSVAPYDVIVNPKSYLPGSPVTVTLRSNSTTFIGFMIQARRVDPMMDQTEPLGTFTVVNGTRAACSSQALVHSSIETKTFLTTTWSPPTISSGDVIFRVTFVSRKNVFWTNVQSETVYDAGRMQRSTRSMMSMYMATPMTPGSTNITKDISCGQAAGCFSTCTAGHCDYVVSWHVMGDCVVYTLKSSYPAPGFYLALGLSSDHEMGDDSVLGCAFSYGMIDKFTAMNEGHGSPAQFNDAEVILQNASYTGGVLTCVIVRPIVGLGQRYDLSKNWTLFFAKGVANTILGRIHLYFHEEDYYMSSALASAYTTADLGGMKMEENKEEGTTSKPGSTACVIRHSLLPPLLTLWLVISLGH